MSLSLEKSQLATAPALKLQLRGVSKTFAGTSAETLAVENIDLDIRQREFVCLVGPSGCGKTTLLRLIAGLELPSAGSVELDGAPVKGPGPDRMVMFQEAALFPWLSALGNVEFGLRSQGLSRAESRRRALEQLEMVGLGGFVNRHPHELSGGMKQRVALARALAPNPGMLLMDEPFTALDALVREQLYLDLQRIWAARGQTIILVTHNVREAVCLGSRVLVLSAHPGRLCADFEIGLPRPRDINDPDLTAAAGEVKEALRRYMAPTPEVGQ